METKNLTKEEVNSIISTFPYEPIFNKVIITLKKKPNLNKIYQRLFCAYINKIQQ